MGHGRLVLLAIGALMMLPVSPALAFGFNEVVSVDDMHELLRREAPMGAGREQVRAMLVGEGGAALHVHPDQAGVEKYLYDVNMCALHVFRWNISANFNAAGALTQIYVNGERVHARGDADIDPSSRPTRGVDEVMYRVQFARPEASKGENVVSYLLYDVDRRSNVASDEFAVGGGPSRVDPGNFGRLRAYSTERWRSIFDEDRATLVNYWGRCP